MSYHINDYRISFPFHSEMKWSLKGVYRFHAGFASLWFDVMTSRCCAGSMMGMGLDAGLNAVSNVESDVGHGLLSFNVDVLGFCSKA